METENIDLGALLADIRANDAAEIAAYAAEVDSRVAAAVVAAAAPACSRCFGRGVIEAFRHIDNGVCFACNGGRY